MANLGFNFDANAVQPTESFDVLPAGYYPMMIIDSEMKPTSTGGQMLVLTCEVIDGPNKGRRIWERLNLINNNQKAVEIAQRSLSGLCHATGEMNVQDSQQLHHKPVIGQVKVDPAQNGYDASNSIKSWLPYSAENQAKCGGVQAPAATTAQAPSGAPAWAK